MVTEYGMSSKLGAVKYGTEHGDPFLGRTMGNQADYSHEVAQIIDDEVRKLIEAAHTEAWEILTEYRDVLDILAGELLEKETLHRVELQAIFADVKKRPRLTMFDDFGGRVPSDKPPIKTPGELAIERGRAVAAAGARARVQGGHRRGEQGRRGSSGAQRLERCRRQRFSGQRQGRSANGAPGSTQPDYGAPAGWHAPGWPPPQAVAVNSRRDTGIRRRRRLRRVGSSRLRMPAPARLRRRAALPALSAVPAARAARPAGWRPRAHPARRTKAR